MENCVIKVYTKPNCGFCTDAKGLLISKSLPFEELKLGEDFIKQDLLDLLGLENDSKITMPQIFIDGKAVGGFTELNTFLNGV